MTIPDQIRKAREAGGLSQEQAAAKAGVVGSTWSRWERGETEPTFEQLGKIAKLLGVSLGVKP